ncbi:hypothetical protein JXD20_04730 [Candidatus Peregrinibacteria bacterium]|nr:hypothetical protein [Candidatus Peregrinibacteria bacterium]
MLKHFQKIIGKSTVLLLSGIILLTGINPVYARIVFKSEFLIEDNGSDTFIIDAGGDVTGNVSLQFGNSLSETITFDTSNDWFDFSNDLNLNQNQIKNFTIDNLATAPLTPMEGQVYYNTTDEQTYMYTSTGWEPIGYHALTHINGEDDIPLATETTKGLMDWTQVVELNTLAAQSDEINRNTIDNNLVLGENVISNVAYLTYENPEDTFFVANIENTEYEINNNISPGIALTGGTDTNPTLNYVYVKDGGIVEASTTNPDTQTFDWVPIAEVLVGTVGASDATYYYIENLTNFIRNFIRDVNRRLRLDQTLWLSGTEFTNTGLEVQISAGSVMHIHQEIDYPAKNTASTDLMLDQYYNTYGVLDVTNYDDGAGGNDPIGNNKYFKLFIWGDIYGGLHMERQLNPPTAEYTSIEQAIEDPDKVAVNGVPVAWGTVGFPIAHLIMQEGGTDVLRIIDLRGIQGSSGTGAGAHEQNTDVGTTSNTFTIDSDGDGTDITLQFGGTLTESLFWDNSESAFVLTDSLNIIDDLTIGASAETITNPAFTLDGNDVFIEDSLGVKGPIYTDATATKYVWLDINGAVRTSAAAGTVNSGTSPAVNFDAGGNSRMSYSFPIPDDWQSGTDLQVEVFWSPEDVTAGNVYFELDYQSWANGETISGATTLNSTQAAPGTALELTRFTFTIPAAALDADDMVNIRLSREAGNVANTYTNDINILMLRLNYTGKKLQ